MGSLVEVGGKEQFPKPLDPFMIELTRLENQLRDKERELGVAHSENKALKVTELLKDKAIVELNNELKGLDEKLRKAEKLLEYKNLEVKKLIDEKKEASVAQYAAESTLRRYHAAQKDEESISIDDIIAPLESDIKMYRHQIAALQEDNKALERLTKSKEAALIEAEKILHSALERALIVENVQNQNLELRRRIEICQEENKLLEKAIRQKVGEVEKLTQTIRGLEESILSGGAAANAVRDYQRQISELNEERRTLERELARVKVSANRVATVAANEWKDENDKVMPIKQWLEERKFLQGEMQRLRDKVAISERTAKAESQLKDRLRLRLKTLEEGLKHMPCLATKQDENSGRVFGFSTHNVGPKMRSSSQPRASIASNKTSVLQQPNSPSGGVDSTRIMTRTNSLKAKFIPEGNLVRKNFWAPRSKFFDDSGKENTERKVDPNGQEEDTIPRRTEAPEDFKVDVCGKVELGDGCGDMVSGFLYDRLQKEVINLRKFHEEKDGLLNDKDDQIKLLLKKVDALMKAMEVESKKMRREAAAREKEMSVKSEVNKQNSKITNIAKRFVKQHEASMNSRT